MHIFLGNQEKILYNYIIALFIPEGPGDAHHDQRTEIDFHGYDRRAGHAG
jgi:hypothetical protein